jgi:NADPH:quinone reductase-like Zn-dependent oxidoreductase
MKAAVFTKYGSPDVLELKEVAKPFPRDDEVLIRVHAASLNDWDWGALHGVPFVNRLMFGLLNPKKQILGSDIAGWIETVGRNVRRDVRQFRPGQKLLFNGAGGGTFAIQIAKLYGAEVTGVDGPGKLDMLRSMGAAHVIDYTREDFTRNGQRYDLILDVKTTRSVFDCARALSPDGTYVTVGGSMARLFQALLLGPWISMTRARHIRILALKPNKGLAEMNELFEAGKVAPVIDRVYRFNEVPEAFRHYGGGLQKGKVAIAFGQSDAS